MNWDWFDIKALLWFGIGVCLWLILVGCVHKPDILREKDCVKIKAKGMVSVYFCDDIPKPKGKTP